MPPDPVGQLDRSRGRPPLHIMLLGILVVGCAVRGPELDPKEHVRGERQRVVRETFASLWPAVLGALPDEGLRVAHADQKRGAIATRPVHYRGQEVQKRLAEIADLSRARAAGLGRATDLEVTYYLLLAPAGDAGTNLRIRSTIDAIDRADTIFSGPGLFRILPRRVEVPSRGVVERDLFRRLAANLFTTEEMLFLLGEPGID